MSSLTVVIPTHKRPSLLERALNSLARCERPASYLETIVVENGGRHGAEAVVRRAAPFLKVRYLYSEGSNKSVALNRALKEISGGLIVFFDDDVRMDEYVLVEYQRASNDNPEKTFFGGRLGCDYEKEIPEWMRTEYPLSRRGYELEPGETFKKYRFFFGANWAGYRAEIIAAGGFDETIGPGKVVSVGEEKSLQGRLCENGVVPVGVPGARVWHYVPASEVSIFWILLRRYKHGLYRGFTSDVPHDNTILGFPRTLVDEFIKVHLYAVWKSLRSRAGRQEQLRVWQKTFQCAGSLHGSRLRRRAP